MDKNDVSRSLKLVETCPQILAAVIAAKPGYMVSEFLIYCLVCVTAKSCILCLLNAEKNLKHLSQFELGW